MTTRTRRHIGQTGNAERFPLRMPHEINEALGQIAQAKQSSINSVIVQFIEAGIEAWKEQQERLGRHPSLPGSITYTVSEPK